MFLQRQSAQNLDRAKCSAQEHHGGTAIGDAATAGVGTSIGPVLSVRRRMLAPVTTVSEIIPAGSRSELSLLVSTERIVGHANWGIGVGSFPDLM